jgi:hypothetical protein
MKDALNEIESVMKKYDGILKVKIEVKYILYINSQK